MSLRSRADALVAKQLGHPSGIIGRLVSKGLNRGNRGLIEASVAALGVASGSVVADVGFGGGLGLQLLLEGPENLSVHGVEVSAAMIAQAESRFAKERAAGRLRLHRAPMSALPFDSASLDGLITVNTIYFMEDLGLALHEVARALKPSGRAVIGIGDPDAMEEMSFTSQGFHLRPIAEIEEALGQAQLEVLEHRRSNTGRVPSHLLIVSTRSASPG